MNIKSMGDNTITMARRCLLLSLRNVETLVTSILVPAFMMLLFVWIFGGAMNVGDVSYVNYIVPGIILQSIGQSSTTTAIRINNDINKGIIERFRSMPIAQSSVLSGHIVEAVTRKLFTVLIVIGVALLVGFRPTAGTANWLIAIGLIILYTITISWLSLIFGLISNNPEGAGSLAALVSVLPYLSSGFAPTEVMPTAVRAFAENQPLTPIIESLRALLLDQPIGNNLWIAIAWCIGILIFSYLLAVRIYKAKMSN